MKEEIMKFKYSNLLIGLLLPLTYATADQASLIPPDAKAGECYAKVVLPAKYKTVEERVLIKEASEKITVVPAKYEWVNEKVEIAPTSIRIIAIPAKYKKVVESIEVKPATRVWKTSTKKNSAPVSKEILVAAKLKGVELDSATPGSCYKEYFTSEKFKVVEEDIVVQKESQKIEIIPAKYEMVEKSIEVSPASKKTVEIPATYEYKEDKVLVEKAKTVWKKGANPAQKLSGATGEIMCLVKVPAKYKIIKKRVVKTPASIKVIDIPAVTKIIKIKKLVAKSEVKKTIIPAVHKKIEKRVLEHKSEFVWHKVGDKIEQGWKSTGHSICLIETPALSKKITKTVLDTPPSTKEVNIEATFKNIKIKKMISEAKEIKTPIEAEYKMVEKKIKVTDATQGWERILCQTNMNKEVILKIQTALNKKDYNPGKIDGVMGRDTRIALDKYQRDNSLATGGITYETLNALKIEL